MRKIFTAICALLATGFLASAQRSDCSVSPYPNTITQPDGSQVTLVAYGTESVHYLETAEGYTVLQNKDKVYEYAVQDEQGNLTLSGIKAVNSIAAAKFAGKSAAIDKHMRYSAAQRSLLKQYFNQLEEANTTTLGKAGASVFPSTGNRKVLVLLVQYPDIAATVPKENFEMLFNQINYNGTGSFKDYYLAASFGKLNLSVDVYGWYTARNNHDFYGKTSSSNYGNATRQLLVNALQDADSAINYTNYDLDADGYVDAVMILHSGIGAEESSAPNSGDYIWSFRSTLSNSATPILDGKKFSAYAIFPERRYSTNAQVGIGVIAHEFGHIIDLPDLYAVDYSSEGIGNYGIMGGGPWLNNEKTPSMQDAWCRVAMGWMTPVVIGTNGSYKIPKALVDSNFAFRINTPLSNEYFLLENRQLKKFDAYLPSKGLAIWHINTDLAGKLSQVSNVVNNDTANFGVGLVQADGLRELERGINRGNAGDLYPGSRSNKLFTPSSSPTSALYTLLNGIRRSSNIFITNITMNSDSSITFNFGTVVSAGFTASAAAGCVPMNVSFNNTSLAATGYRWEFGDGKTATSEKPSHTFTTAGTFSVKLYVYDTNNVVVDSATQSIRVSESPNAAFTTSRNGNVITFNNTSTGADYYQWHFGDSLTDNGTSPTVTLSGSGMLKFYVVAFNSVSCTDTAFGQIDVWPTGIAEANRLVSNLQAYPNPFNSKSELHFSLASKQAVEINIYNLLGERTATLENAVLEAGDHVYSVNGTQMPANGMYIVRIKAGDQTAYLRLLKQ